ncbi:hypothetical protein GW17_00017459 [Ensete ventricosum]|nr:hypothetical protein GW17_00017459 [Ensete ventricosum]
MEIGELPFHASRFQPSLLQVRLHQCPRPFASASSTRRCSARDWASAARTSAAATASGFPPPSSPGVLGAEGSPCRPGKSDASRGSNTPQIYVAEASSLCQTGVPCVSGLRSGSRGASKACSGRRLVRGVGGPFSPGGSVDLVRGFASILLPLADKPSPPVFEKPLAYPWPPRWGSPARQRLTRTRWAGSTEAAVLEPEPRVQFQDAPPARGFPRIRLMLTISAESTMSREIRYRSSTKRIRHTTRS